MISFRYYKTTFTLARQEKTRYDTTMDLAVVILAAGSGTRMKSKLPKVMHQVAGKPMVCHVVEEAGALNPTRLILVVSPNNQPVKDCLSENEVEYAVQEEQLGTAHAVLQASALLQNFEGNILVLYGDTPLIEASSLRELVTFHEETGASATVVTAQLDNPFGYGRIIRSESGITGIIEEKDASPAQRSIKEVNSGMYCFKSQALFEKIKEVKADNRQKEYYLTDVIGLLVGEGALVEGFELEPEHIFGVNSRSELALANQLINNRIVNKWLDNGVTIIDPANTYIEKDVEIGAETIIYPYSVLRGKIKIGASCEIGPFAHLRPGTVVGDKGKVGAFSEVKNSLIGTGSKVPHLSYIGDTEIGEGVNIGAGSITCNYDGRKKHKTVIKKGAFIGSDTMLVAPVTVGENAYTGAGSVISKDVPDEALGLERSEQKNIKDYAKKKKGG